MVSRIKFIKNSEGLMESKYIYKSETTGALYSVKVDFENGNYEIKNISSGRIYKNDVEYKVQKTLKRKLKEHLEHFGVQFKKEKHSFKGE